MLRSSAWVFASKLLVAGLNFATIVLISRWLGPAERGICSWYLVVIAMALVCCDMISGPAAGYLLKEYPAAQIRYASYAWSALVSVCTTAVFFFLNKSNAAGYPLLTLLCWLNAANSIHLHLILAKQKFKLFSWLSLLSPLLTILAVAALFYAGAVSRMSYLYALLIAWLACFAVSLFFVSGMQQEKAIHPFKKLVTQGFRFGLSNQLSHFAGLLNNRLVFFLLPASLLGVYANSLSLAEASLMIPGSLGQVLYASLLNKKHGQHAGAARSLLWVNAALMLLVFLLVLVIPASLYRFIFGQAFAGVKSYLVILSASMIFYSGYLICSYWQSAQGQFLRNFYANLASLAVNGIVTGYFLFNGGYNARAGAVSLGTGFAAMFLVAVGQVAKDAGGFKKLVSPPSAGEISAFAGRQEMH